jgi:uncharacterized protein YndB with AHSA1/START domain
VPQETKNDRRKEGRPGDQAVLKATGKDWKAWFEILDLAGGQRMDHKGIVAYLEENYAISPWWQQQVTVSYEQARGLRRVHEMPDGYQISRSKIVPTPVSELYAAWVEPDLRETWLGLPSLQIRSARKNQSLYISWSEPTSLVTVNFYAKGAEKTQITVQHSKLNTSEQAEEMKAYWSLCLSRLKAYLEG